MRHQYFFTFVYLNLMSFPTVTFRPHFLLSVVLSIFFSLRPFVHFDLVSFQHFFNLLSIEPFVLSVILSTFCPLVHFDLQPFRLFLPFVILFTSGPLRPFVLSTFFTFRPYVFVLFFRPEKRTLYLFDLFSSIQRHFDMLYFRPLVHYDVLTFRLYILLSVVLSTCFPFNLSSF